MQRMDEEARAGAGAALLPGQDDGNPDRFASQLPRYVEYDQGVTTSGTW